MDKNCKRFSSEIIPIRIEWGKKRKKLKHSNNIKKKKKTRILYPVKLQ